MSLNGQRPLVEIEYSLGISEDVHRLFLLSSLDREIGTLAIVIISFGRVYDISQQTPVMELSQMWGGNRVAKIEIIRAGDLGPGDCLCSQR